MMTNSKEQSPAPAAKNGFSLITDEKLLEIYATMLKCRMVEDRARILLKMNSLNGDAGAGQEAIAAAVGIDLLPEDTLRVIPDALIHLFVKGLPLGELFARPLKAVAPALSFAAQLKLSTGDAVAFKANKNNEIAVVFSSSEFTYHESWLEALRFAGAQRLPILFVSQGTNQPASPDAQSNGRRSRLKGKTYGFPAITVQGNDAVAVYRVACEAIAHARKGDGPTLIECQCWQEGDALMNMEKYLIRKGLFSEKFKRQVEGGFIEELDAVEQVTEKGRKKK